jgi:hypothetical protein
MPITTNVQQTAANFLHTGSNPQVRLIEVGTYIISYVVSVIRTSGNNDRTFETRLVLDTLGTNITYTLVAGSLTYCNVSNANVIAATMSSTLILTTASVNNNIKVQTMLFTGAGNTNFQANACSLTIQKIG